MESKYTKGVWEYVSHLSSDRTHEVNKVMCGTVSICVIRTNNQEQAAANALLIASAPSLLEALEEILYKDSDGNYRIGQHGDTLVSDKIQSAIKKAKGE